MPGPAMAKPDRIRRTPLGPPEPEFPGLRNALVLRPRVECVVRWLDPPRVTASPEGLGLNNVPPSNIDPAVNPAGADVDSTPPPTDDHPDPENTRSSHPRMFHGNP